MRKTNIAVFASGTGSNFSAIVSAVKTGMIKANIPLLICDNPEAPVIKKAVRAKIRVVVIAAKDFSDRDQFEKAIIEVLRGCGIDLIVLAGFMRILSPAFVKRYPSRIINIHPALLPSFKGAHAIRDAFEYGVKVTGVTVHFVDEKTDHGPVIMQEPVRIENGQTLKRLGQIIHKVEHRVYPRAIALLLRGRLRVRGRKVVC
ncbi:MAG: phosphoribosylglycinamide formyltransferase [Candidatus Omnitrophota bacterium]|jgi:phosphoribosylglycinamide formyltransferase-1